MKTNDFPLASYLVRIGLKGQSQPNEQGLREIHEAQAYNIPFENLDIHLGRAISLKPDDLIAKLVHQRRGGYCFELNGILHLALKAIGFAVQPVLARTLYRRVEPTARTHEVLIVTVADRRWLVDVGFGGPGLRSPIPLSTSHTDEQCGEHFRLRTDNRYGWVLEKKIEDSFTDLYAFAEEVTLDVDIEMANHYTATWPSSIFRLHRMCARPKPWGRVTLNDMDLNIYRDGNTFRKFLPSGPEYMAALAEHFGLDLDAAYEDFVPLGDGQT